MGININIKLYMTSTFDWGKLEQIYGVILSTNTIYISIFNCVYKDCQSFFVVNELLHAARNVEDSGCKPSF